MVDKIIVCYIGDKCADTLEVSLLSIKNIAKQIIFVWGMEDSKILEILKSFNQISGIPITLINAKWDSEDRNQNGRQRNIYLFECMRKYYADWILVLDPDEVLEDQDKLIEQINKTDSRIISPKMRHLLWNFSREDSTEEIHYVQHRLFKVDYRYLYPEVEHPVLCMYGIDPKIEKNKEIVIWHLSHCRNMFDVRNKFLGNVKKSNMHPLNFLIKWYYWHLFEEYPNTQVNYFDLPEALRRYFYLDQFGIEDTIYFENRREMELKHVTYALDFILYFNPKNAYDLGCGGGQLTYLFNRHGIDCLGIDKSNYIINMNKEQWGDKYKQGNIKDLNLEKRDLIICMDVLEHLEYKELDDVLKRIKQFGEWFVFSVPLKGTDCCNYDKTHKIKEDRQWWKNKLTEKGYTIKETPKHWIMPEQIIIAR